MYHLVNPWEFQAGYYIYFWNLLNDFWNQQAHKKRRNKENNTFKHFSFLSALLPMRVSVYEKPQGTRYESNLCGSTLLSSLSLWLKVLLGLCSLTYMMHCFMHSLMSSYNVPVSPQQFSSLSNTALPCQVHLPIQFRAVSDLFSGQ